METTKYKVVINHEEQYSIIPADQKLARGWREIGKTGSKSTCMKFIEEVWTDKKIADKDRILKNLRG
ncbi:MAG: MbtH family NRPS accessory protein [Aliifodinibius sp.]|nr:MbtH family protein [Candidatus Saccharibacteria bacterium]NIV14344.1 MbtH family NRPS accessory protein [Fodinibius sp.]